MEKNILLGQGKHSQVSINEKINVLDIYRYFQENIEDYLKESFLTDEDKDFIYNLSEGNVKFNITKHIEYFFQNNKTDKSKILKYFIFRNKFFLSGKKKINFGYPPYVLLELVSTCNLRCPFCFQTDKTFTKKPFMGIMKNELHKKIVDECDNLGVGAITYGSRGEPTMHPHLSELLSYTRSKKNILEIKLNTNATFLNEKVIHALLKNNINQVVISADHYEKKEYERLRVNSNYEKILKNVDNLFKIRKDFYPNSITEIRVSGVNGDKDFNKTEYKKFWEKRADHVSSVIPMERWNTYENETHPDINDPCENLWDRMYVWFDGKVNPCDADYKSKLSYGDVVIDTIKSIWNNNTIRSCRNKHMNGGRNKILPCDRCGVTFS